MNRRDMLTTTALGMGGFALGTGFAAPACGVSKEKAVRVAGFVIDITKEALPLLDLLNAREIADLVRTKALPAMEKLKDALANTDIPTSQSTLSTVRSALSAIGKALLNLPDSPRRTTIIGILASVNVLLLTVESFIESEMPEAAVKSDAVRAMKPSTVGDKIKAAYEASRP